MRLRVKPSGIYILDHDVDGVRQRVSLGTRDAVEAKRKAQRIVLGLDVETGTASTPAAKTKAVTVEQLLDHVYRTEWREVRSQATINSNIRILTKLVGHLAVVEVSGATIMALRERMEAAGQAPATVNRKLDTLYKALRRATRWDGGHGTGIPLIQRLPDRPTIRVDNYKSRIISADEQTRMFAEVTRRAVAEPMRDWKRFGALLRFLLDTGCRLSEALKMTEDDLITEHGRTWVTFPRYTTKSGEPRRLPLTVALAAEMAVILPRAVAGRPFPLLPSGAWYMWGAIRSALGPQWADVTLHTFRHTCLTVLAKRLPIHKVSFWAGHSDIKITMSRYAHLQSEDLLECVIALDASSR